MKQLVWVDLCSGRGGASQPALDRGWKVIRVDKNPYFKPDIICDLSDLTSRENLREQLLREGARPTLVWASSVCTQFTKWSLPESWACNHGGRAEPDLTLSKCCKDVIDGLGANCWVFENVLASRPFLTPILGPVRAITAGHAFWGNFPGLLPQTGGHKWRLPPSPDRAAIRGMIPYEIGEAICRAVEARAAA